MTDAESLSLRERLLKAIQSKQHQAILFKDLDQVPVGSVGYLSPSRRRVLRDKKGWLHDGRRFNPETGFGTKYTFTSHSGPANDLALVEALFQALVPPETLLVSFKTITQSESDWELGYQSSWTDLAHPTLLGHALTKTALAQLYFAIEQFGGLQESDAYRDLDKIIEQLGEEPAQRLRDAKAEPRGASQENRKEK